MKPTREIYRLLEEVHQERCSIIVFLMKLNALISLFLIAEWRWNRSRHNDPIIQVTK